MICRDCEFYQSGYLWNRCALTESEYFRECIETPCDLIDDNYIFPHDFEPFGFVKGESALDWMKGDNK